MQDLLQTGKSAAAKVREHFQAAIANLDELEAQIVGLNNDDATRIALDLIAQRDRLDLVYDIATRIIGLLYTPPRSEIDLDY